MAINVREKRWAEVSFVASKAKCQVRYETMDLGDGSAVVPALSFSVPGQGGVVSYQVGTLQGASPKKLVFSLEDLRELLRLADEEKGLLGG